MKHTKNHTAAEKWHFAAVLLAGVLLCALLFTSCHVQTIPPVPSTDSSSVRVEVRVDSVWRDRVRIEYTRGDTLILRDSVYVEKLRYVDRHDTLRVRDSIPYCVEVPKPYRERNAYDKATARGFWVLLILCALAVAARVLWRLYVKK